MRREEKRFVLDAVVAKKFVVVAEVPVAFTKVKFWRVDEPVRRRLERVERPPVTVRVPVKLAAEEMVWEFIKPEVMAPRVESPAVSAVAKRFVEDAVVANELVEVAEVVVEVVKIALVAVSLERVLSQRRPVESERSPAVEAKGMRPEVRFETVSEPPESVPNVPVLERKSVEEAFVVKKFVVVAEVPVAFTKVKFWRVVELLTRSEPLPMPERTATSELKVKRSLAESQVRSALGVALPLSKARVIFSVSAVALSLLIVQSFAEVLPVTTVPTRLVASTMSA